MYFCCLVIVIEGKYINTIFISHGAEGPGREILQRPPSVCLSVRPSICLSVRHVLT